MVDAKESFAVSEDATGAAFALTKVVPGTTAASAVTDGLAAACFQDSNGIAVLPSLVDTGKIPVALFDAEGTEIEVGFGSDTNALRAVSIPSDGMKITYRATATFSAAATPTDVFTLTGSATKTVKIARLGMSATQTTSSIVNLSLLTRSTANSGGTDTTPTIVPLDPNDAAATAVVRAYTANPTTLGNLVGNLQNIKFTVPVPGIGGNASSQVEYILNFGDIFSKPIVLRGTGSVFAVNLNSTSITGNSFSMWIEFTEE